MSNVRLDSNLESARVFYADGNCVIKLQRMFVSTKQQPITVHEDSRCSAEDVDGPV